MTDLDDLRQDIKETDRRIIQLIRQRVKTAQQIGAVKAKKGKPIKNYHVEQQVLERMRDLADDNDLLDTTAENITETLIREAVRGQENHRRQQADNDGDSYLVIGGEGKMGGWFQDYLRRGGARVRTVDKGEKADYSTIPPLSEYDAVILTTPVHITPQILSELRQRDPEATVADITSVKSPVQDELRAAKSAGLTVTSFHPMFDHTAKTLNGKNVIIASLGVDEADNRVRRLFTDTAATITSVPLSDHDDYIAYTLGLPHIASLLFGEVLERTETDYETFQELGGQTFLRHCEAAQDVFSENPDVYHAIQHYTDKTNALFEEVHRVVDDIAATANKPTPSMMQSLMQRGSSYFNVNDQD